MDEFKGEDFRIPGAMCETLSLKLSPGCGNAGRVDLGLKTAKEKLIW